MSAVADSPMSLADGDWVLHNVLPPMWRCAQGAEELRTCLCLADPSDWLGGVTAAAARLWDRDGRSIAYADGRGIVTFYEVDRICRRRTRTPGGAA
ncbi:hypothetical protein [Streptomyces lonarensis]|uniref:Uncharacterized protein n=1 Tax=Streptomyces lonarensis TaxID=700599 RepID=A0A7X6CX78_9ACTN|nr:hypothetical protein [Streptomyces lonarensis]NJQ04237.1 hypothetical protein [Streptomyces lonarensis]